MKDVLIKVLMTTNQSYFGFWSLILFLVVNWSKTKSKTKSLNWKLNHWFRFGEENQGVYILSWIIVEIPKTTSNLTASVQTQSKWPKICTSETYLHNFRPPAVPKNNSYSNCTWKQQLFKCNKVWKENFWSLRQLSYKN